MQFIIQKLGHHDDGKKKKSKNSSDDHGNCEPFLYHFQTKLHVKIIFEKLLHNYYYHYHHHRPINNNKMRRRVSWIYFSSYHPNHMKTNILMVPVTAPHHVPTSTADWACVISIVRWV